MIQTCNQISKILFLIILFFSCTNIEEKRRHCILLDGHEYKLWKFDLENRKYNGVRFYFDEEGRCEELILENENYNYSIFNCEKEFGGHIEKKWFLNSDTLRCLGDVYLISKINRDTIRLESTINGEKSYLTDVGLPPK